MKKKTNLILVSLYILLMTFMSACTSSQKNTIDKSEMEKISGLSIGEKESSSREILLKNSTDLNIISISLLPVGGKLPDSYVLGDGKEISPDETVTWYLESNEEDGKNYYIQVILKDGTFFIIRDLSFDEIKNDSILEIDYENGIGFVRYVDSDGNKINTFEKQKNEADLPLDLDYDDDNAVIGVPID